MRTNGGDMRTDYSVLIVDDDPINLKLAGEALNEKYQLYFARGGAQALEFLAQNSDIDLILLDLFMPGMPGFKVHEELQKNPEAKHIPVVYLTIDQEEETVTKAFGYGASDFIVKPFRVEELQARIKYRLKSDRLQKELRRALEEKQNLVSIIEKHLLYIRTDMKGNIASISPAFCELMECSCEQVIGQPVSIFRSPHTPDEFYFHLWQELDRNQCFSDIIENRSLKSERSHWYKLEIQPYRNTLGEQEGYIAFYINIDEQVRYQTDANRDHLTGIYNRAHFSSELVEEIYRFKRYGHTFSLIMFDIDHFKAVNDSYGHDAGDMCLIEFAKLAKGALRQSDIVARWGGEEFMILCPETDAKGAAVLAEKMRALIEHHHFPVIGKKTASFGVTEFHPSMTEEVLLKRVDQELYQAKEDGRNRVKVYQA